MAILKLRWYQEEAIDSIFRYFETNNKGDPALALPTGTGKGVIIAKFVERVMKAWPDQRILMLTHVKELIEQNASKLLEVWPQAPVGIYSAGLKRKQTLLPVCFGGIQSVARLLQRNPKGLGTINLIIIDECHLLSPKDSSQYQQVITTLRRTNPRLRVIGLTATPYRLGDGLITDGEGLFDDLCYDLCSMDNFNRLLDEGFMSPLIPKKPNLEVDLSKVRKTAGDYNRKALQEVFNVDSITQQAIEESIACAGDRKAWLVFASGVEHAEAVAECLRVYGISAEAVHSKQDEELNTKRIEAFKRGELKAVVNYGKLTTGFDYPSIDLIIMLRGTTSTALWVQMLGRGTRPAPGKENCLVLDFAGNTRRLGPINDPVIPDKSRGKGKGEAPVKICESCGMYNHASVRKCAHCGYAFPPNERKFGTTASEEELIKRKELKPKPVLKDFKVSKVTYRLHKPMRREGAMPSLCVTYKVGWFKSFSEWVCLEHTGYPRRKAVAWWAARTALAPPSTAKEALEQVSMLAEPKRIKVNVAGKYPEIVSYIFNDEDLPPIQDEEEDFSLDGFEIPF